MAARTAAKRARALADFILNNPGAMPPVHVLPPGVMASKRPTREQLRTVRSVLQEQVKQLANLTEEECARLKPALARAQRELKRAMATWTHETADGELRWSAQKYRAAFAQVRMMAASLGVETGGVIKGAVFDANWLAIKHLAEETARFSKTFTGSLQKLPIDVARQLAGGGTYIIPRIRTSSARYASRVAEDIRQRVLTDLLKGASVRETVDKLVAHGGPKGWVALRGVKGERGAIVEKIPEGLFARYRYWAERVVRTELASAYNQRALASIHEAARLIPGSQKRWCTDGTGCPKICDPIDGQTVDVNQSFITPVGACDCPPGHPNCRCRVGMWNRTWPRIASELGIGRKYDYEPDNEVDDIEIRVGSTVAPPKSNRARRAAKQAWDEEPG